MNRQLVTVALLAIAFAAGWLTGVAKPRTDPHPFPTTAPTTVPLYTRHEVDAMMRDASDQALPCAQFGHGHARFIVTSSTEMVWHCTDGHDYRVAK